MHPGFGNTFEDWSMEFKKDLEKKELGLSLFEVDHYIGKSFRE
jgi:hypothetical protein